MSGPFGSSQWMYKSGGYEIANSVRFDDATSAHMTMTPGAAGDRRLWTWSAWVKQATPANGTNQIGMFGSYTNNNDTVNIQIDGTAGHFHFEDYTGSYNALQVTEAKLLDYSAWYHLMVVLDTAQSTAANRVKMYINGVLAVTKTGGSHAYPDQNAQLKIANNAQHQIGITNGAYHFDGYMADINFVDGAALTPASFGETGDYGEWKPIDTSDLTFGDEGFHLDFKLPTANATNLGKDTSGNSNNFALANIAATDQMIDSPTNNFCTLNHLQKFVTNVPTQTEGALKTICGSVNTGSKHCIAGTMGMTSGKWYFEVLIGDTANSHFSHIGVANSDDILFSGLLNTIANSGNVPWDSAYGWGFDGYNGNKEHNNSQASYGSQVSLGDIIGVAVDMDNGKIWFAENNTFLNSGDPAAGSNAAYTNVAGTILPVVSTQDGATAFVTMNFGQDSTFAGGDTSGASASDSGGIGDFYYAPPSGFLALCASNLPDTGVIPSEYFNTVLWTGNDTARTISGVGFQPDFNWIRNRDIVTNHLLFDAVRGASKSLRSDSTAAEGSASDEQTGYVSDGFTLSTGEDVNGNAEKIVAWNWKANGAGSSNTEGSINTGGTSANTDAGFSISTYTGNATEGATIGHGLSKAPTWMLVKKLTSGGWFVYHQFNTAAPETDELNLEVTEATQDSANIWNDTAPTTTVMSLGNNGGVNANNVAFVLYCWHDVEGFSKFGGYTGNGVADGPFIYTGFRPAFVLTKVTNAADDWSIADNKRSPFNVAGKSLRPNSTAVEDSAADIDILSNGFKVRQADSHRINYGADTFIYMAFAENPFKYANGR